MKGIGDYDGRTDFVLLIEVLDRNVTWHFIKLKYFMRHREQLKVEGPSYVCGKLGKPRIWLLYFLATRIFSAGHVKAKYSMKRKEKAQSTNNVDMSIRRGIWKKRVPSFAPASGPIWGFPWWQQSCSLPYLRPTSEQPRGASRLIFLLPIYLDMDLEPEGKLVCSNFGLKSEHEENGRAKAVINNSCKFFLMNRHPVLRLHEVPLHRLHATPLPNTSNHLLRVNKGQNTKYPAHVSKLPPSPKDLVLPNAKFQLALDPINDFKNMVMVSMYSVMQRRLDARQALPSYGGFRLPTNRISRSPNSDRLR